LIVFEGTSPEDYYASFILNLMDIQKRNTRKWNTGNIFVYWKQIVLFKEPHLLVWRTTDASDCFCFPASTTNVTL